MENKTLYDELTNVTYEKIITILSVLAIMLIIYRLVIFKENFDQVDICDYNSPDPNQFCKSIQKGCSDLIYENKNLNITLENNCTNLPTDTKDVIDKAIVCNDTTNKIIMNNYVQNEVCSQIKNFPDTIPEVDGSEKLSPSTNILLETSLQYTDNSPSTSYKPLDNLTILSNNVYGNVNNSLLNNNDMNNNTIKYVNFAPF